MRFRSSEDAERGARWGSGVLIGVILALSSWQAAEASFEDARELAARGEPEQALGMVEDELVGNPESPDGLFLKGVLLVELRRAGEARDVFARLIDLHPELPEPYNNLAVIQAADGDYESAVETLRRSLDTHASYRTAYENLTKIYTQLASEAYGQALDAEPVERPDVVELVLLGNLETRAPEAVAEPPVEIATVTEPPPPPEVEAEAMAGPPAEPPAEAAVPSGGPTLESVAPFVAGWRAAWQEQRVDDYLDSYSMDFEPAGGLSRERWAAQRRSRLTAPEFIRVTLAYLDEPVLEGSTASIRFLQSYESDSFQDRVTKTLVLRWEEGGWRILEERSD